MKNYKLLLCIPLAVFLFACDSSQQTADKSASMPAGDSAGSMNETVAEAIDASKEAAESVKQELVAAEEKVEQVAEVIEEKSEKVEALVKTVVAEKTAASGQDIYQKSCVSCHGTGAANAPKLGDSAAWKARIDKGMDVLYASAMNGIPGTAMMAKGTCGACSEEELKAAVDFMVEKAR